MSEIEKITANSPEASSLNITQQNIKQLKQLFPDVFSENKIDFEALKAILGEEIDDSEERYNFTWNGKNKARQIAQTPSTGTLRPSKEESVNWDTTENLFIEGDNLEVLKLLQKSYHKKVKMIYIDPPYNTGKDFVYKDNFHDSINNYLEQTGQLDSVGKKISTNSDTSGRYHSSWLNMIYPRLKLAKNLLTDDGAIFISIDDTEQKNLKAVCDEVFGEDNFIGMFIWKRRVSSAMADNNVSIDQDYVLCYQKGELENLKGIEKNFDKYKNPDNDPRGSWILDNLTVGMNASMRPNQAYDLVDPETGNVFPFNPNRVWAFIPESMKKMINEGRIYFPKDPSQRPMQKRFRDELKSDHNPISTLLMDKVGLNTEATRVIQDLMGGNIFEYSKPLSLLKTLIPQVCVDENDIVLDFFAGSCTTAQAVMELNVSSNKNLKYIMVQLPEPCEKTSSAFKAGYDKVSDIGKERIKRVINSLQEKEVKNVDAGFKVLKLDKTNIRPWDADFDNLEKMLQQAAESIKANRSNEDVLYEILLKYGIELTVSVETKTVDSKKVFIVGAGDLIVCLDDNITSETVEGIAMLKDELVRETTQVVFKDAGFTDSNVKTNAIQILKQAGIDDIKSI